MKVQIFCVMLAPVSACVGQGQLVFSNFGGGVNAPITNAAGQLISASTPYVADLFWSPDLNAAVDSLAAAGYNQAFAGSGYFVGGTKTFSGIGLAPILVQVRVWDTTYGSTYYDARDKGGEFGFSSLFTVTPLLPPLPAASLLGLQSFRLQRLPRLTSTLTSTNTIVFSWPTEQTTYAVQQNPDLLPTNWTTLPNIPITVGQNQQVIFSVPPSTMFYRLVSQ